VKYNILFIYTIFLRTHLQVRLAGGFSRLMAQTTRTRAKMWFWGVVDIAAHLRGQITKNPDFWAQLTKRFQAKRAKNSNSRNQIATEFCTAIKTTK